MKKLTINKLIESGYKLAGGTVDHTWYRRDPRYQSMTEFHNTMQPLGGRNNESDNK